MLMLDDASSRAFQRMLSNSTKGRLLLPISVDTFPVAAKSLIAGTEGSSPVRPPWADCTWFCVSVINPIFTDLEIDGSVWSSLPRVDCCSVYSSLNEFVDC